MNSEFLHYGRNSPTFYNDRLNAKHYTNSSSYYQQNAENLNFNGCHLRDDLSAETDTEDTPTCCSQRGSFDSLTGKHDLEESRVPSFDSYDVHHGGVSLEPVVPKNQYSLSPPATHHSPAPIPACGHSGGAHSQFKCRQLPCRTFISTGSCPYGDRCVFLHDPSIVSKPVYIRSKRKSKDDQSVDAFFWPTMSLSSVMGKVDNKHLPSVNQPYIVPTPSSYAVTSSNNDSAVFSMWEHFLDFLKVDNLSIVTVPRTVSSMNVFNSTNNYTGRKRLPILMKLSQGQSVSIENEIIFPSGGYR